MIRMYVYMLRNRPGAVHIHFHPQSFKPSQQTLRPTHITTIELAGLSYTGENICKVLRAIRAIRALYSRPADQGEVEGVIEVEADGGRLGHRGLLALSVFIVREV